MPELRTASREITTLWSAARAFAPLLLDGLDVHVSNVADPVSLGGIPMYAKSLTGPGK